MTAINPYEPPLPEPEIPATDSRKSPELFVGGTLVPRHLAASGDLVIATILAVVGDCAVGGQRSIVAVLRHDGSPAQLLLRHGSSLLQDTLQISRQPGRAPTQRKADHRTAGHSQNVVPPAGGQSPAHRMLPARCASSSRDAASASEIGLPARSSCRSARCDVNLTHFTSHCGRGAGRIRRGRSAQSPNCGGPCPPHRHTRSCTCRKVAACFGVSEKPILIRR